MRTPILALPIALVACSEPRAPIGRLAYDVDPAELHRIRSIDKPAGGDREAFRRAVEARVRDALPGAVVTVEQPPDGLVVDVAGEWTAAERDGLLLRLERSWGPSLALRLEEAAFEERGTTLVAERARVLAYLAATEARSLDVFNALEPADGGPPDGVFWLRKVWTAPDGELADHDLLPVELPAAPFGFWSLETGRMASETGADGRAALRVVLGEHEAERLAAFATAHRNRSLVIVCGKYAISAPRIEGRLVPSFLVSGLFTDAEIERILALASGREPRPLVLRASG